MEKLLSPAINTEGESISENARAGSRAHKTTEQLSTEEGIAKLFGGRLKGEVRVSSSRLIMGEPRVIAGIKVPDKPQVPENCCMSGCINCVWETYYDDIYDWEEKQKLAAMSLVKKGGVWPADFHPPVQYLKPENLPESLRNNAGVLKRSRLGEWNKVPVEMRVFAEFEKKIKGKRASAAAYSCPTNRYGESI